MYRFPVPVVGKALKKRRINALVDQAAKLENEMRDVLAALIELTEPNDDLHVEVVRIVKALDG